MSVDSTSSPFGTLTIEISWLSFELLTLSEVLSTTLIDYEFSSALTEGTVSWLDVPSLSDKDECSCDKSSTNSKNSSVLIRELLLSSVDGSTSEDSFYLLDKCVDWVGSEPTVSSMVTRNLGSSDM